MPALVSLSCIHRSLQLSARKIFDSFRLRGIDIFRAVVLATGAVLHKVSASRFSSLFGWLVTSMDIMACHFATNLTFFMFSGLIPCYWSWATTLDDFYPTTTAFSVRAQEIKFSKYYGKPKNTFSSPLSYWRSKSFALMRGFQVWPQNWAWIIFDPYFGRKTPKHC